MFTPRPLTPQDESWLWDMLYLAIYVPEHSTPPDRSILQQPDLARYVKDWGRPHDYGLAAIQLDATKPIGAAWWRLFTSPDQGYGYVDDQTPELSLAVLPSYRNQGIGTQLLTQLLRAAQAEYRSVSLSVSTDNPARRLYTRLGFEEVGQQGTSVTMRVDLGGWG